MEISTQMTYDNFLKYFLYSQKKIKAIYRAIGIIFIILAVSDAISCLFEPLVIDDLIIDIAFIVSLLVIGILFLVLIDRILTNAASKAYHSNKFIATNPVYTFQFNKNNYKVLVTSPMGIEEGTYSYDMIYSIIETDNFIYIKIGNNTAYIINKIQENIENLNKIITFLRDEKQINYIVDIKKK